MKGSYITWMGGVTSSKFWFIKKGYYYDYVRIIGPIFIRFSKHIATGSGL